MLPLVAYYRVSTQKQGRSGLGLEAQRAAVASFAKAEGFDIAAEYTEIETAKGADALSRRPQLAAALKHAKRPEGFRVRRQARPPQPRRRLHRRADERSACRSSSPRWARTSIHSLCTFMPPWPSRSGA